MSAIVGIYYLDGRSLEHSTLERMLEKLSHCGMDGKNTWQNGSIGFGHRMLWTTPESLKENLPLIDKAGKYVLTADARIDNRNELINMLNLKDKPNSEITDSEIILASYEKWDELCPEKLIGDFVFAIWDKQKQKLFCARDHFGVKPFYYFFSDNVFVFASEIKALFCLKEVPREINNIKVAEYLASLFDDTSTTFYNGILRLPPAHSLTIKMNKIQTKCYWKLDPSYEVKLRSDNEYAEKFCDIFKNAIHVRLRSNFKVGSMLSGGLDSSSISCVAGDIISKNGANHLTTFSIIYNKVTECDERPFINAVLSKNKFNSYFFEGDKQGPLSDLDSILSYQDEPFFAPHLFVTWQTYDFIKKQGFRTILDGFDGDTTLSSSGLGYLHELALSKNWLTFISTLKGLSKNWKVSFYKYLLAFIRHYEINPIISNSSFLKPVRKIYRLFKGQKNHIQTENKKEKWKNIINHDLITITDIDKRYHEWKENDPFNAHSEKEEHYRDITSSFKSYALEILNRTASAFSLDMRYPFWDKNMVEFCYGLPPEKKLHRGWSKYSVRFALNNVLPLEVQWRRNKTDFTPNILYCLFTYNRNLLEKIIRDSTVVISKYVNITYLNKIYNRIISCHENNNKQNSQDVFSIWKIITLAQWLKNWNTSVSKFT